MIASCSSPSSLKLPDGLEASSFMKILAPLPFGAIFLASLVKFLSSRIGVLPTPVLFVFLLSLVMSIQFLSSFFHNQRQYCRIQIHHSLCQWLFHYFSSSSHYSFITHISSHYFPPPLLGFPLLDDRYIKVLELLFHSHVYNKD